MLGYTFRGEGRHESCVVVVRQAHISDLAVKSAAENGEEVVIFGDTFDRIPRELHCPELQLAFHDGGRRDIREGFAGIFEVGHVVFSRLVERHKSPEHLRESPRNGDVVARGARRDRGLLHVEAGEAEDQGPVRQEYALEGLPQRAVQGDLVGQKVHIFDLVQPTETIGLVDGAALGGPAGGRRWLGPAGAAGAEAGRADVSAPHRHVQFWEDAPAAAQFGPGDRIRRPRDGHARRRGLEPVVHEATPSVVADVFHALAVGEELNSFNETAGVRRAAEHVAGAVRVAEGKRELNGLGIHEVGSRGDGDATYPRRARSKGAQGTRKVLHRLAGLNVVGVPRSQLVVEAGDELVVDGLRHLLHHFTYLCSFRFARLTKGLEGRLGSQTSAVAAGLPADPGPFAARGHGNGKVVQPEGRLHLGPRAPCRTASDLWQRPIPGLALRLRALRCSWMK